MIPVSVPVTETVTGFPLQIVVFIGDTPGLESGKAFIVTLTVAEAEELQPVVVSITV